MSIKNNTTSLQELLEAVNNLPDANSGGVDLPELTNEGTTEDLMLGKELIDGDGNVVTGSFTIDSELNTQNNLIAQIKTAANGLSEQETPIISVGSNGLITATAGDKSATKQLTTQGAQTITPSTSNKTISSGRYLTGTQTIKGDANLIASNIKSGISIFGVNGSYVGSGGSGGSVETVQVVINSENWQGWAWYTDGNYQFHMLNVNDGETQGITCLKNSPVIFSGYGFMANLDNDYSIDYMEDMSSNGMYIYNFTSDTTISIHNCENGEII